MIRRRSPGGLLAVAFVVLSAAPTLADERTSIGDCARLPGNEAGRSVDPGFVRRVEDRSNDTGFVAVIEDQSNDVGFFAPGGWGADCD